MNALATQQAIKQSDGYTVFGLTGGIASGKSFVSSLLVRKLIPVVDADLCARDVIVSGSLGLSQLVDEFGTGILLDNQLNRTKLAELVFGCPEQLAKLNAIMQPLIASHSAYLIRLHQQMGCKLVCYDAALLIESGQAESFRPLVVVACEPEIQLKRLMKRGLSKEQAEARMASQLPTKDKTAVADFVISSNGTKEETTLQVETLIKQLEGKTT